MKDHPELKIYELPVADLVPYTRNAKEHSATQVDTIAASIEEFGNCDPIAVWHNDKGEPEIVEGHGRLLALKKLGHEVAPVIYLDHLSDEQRRAYTHIHNQTTLNSGWDTDTLLADIGDMPEFDWAGFGFDLPKDEQADDTYTMDTDIPQYTPTGNVPPVLSLADTSKTDALLAEIEAASVGENEKAFLRAAAHRHTRIDFKGAAELYAQAPPEMQRLMERQALVIIDQGDAVKNGYVELSSRLADMLAGA